MHENRTRYPKRKTQLYQQLQEIPTKYDVVALVRMEKVRSSQLLPLRKKFKGEVEIMSIKDKVAKKALETLDIPGIKNIIEDLTGQCLFMFTNMSPFKLNVLVGKNKILLLARAGDIASKDIVIPAKNTGVAPGPILTDFKEAGVPTKIDQGTIWITKDTTPVEKGGIISPKLATLLGKLDIKAVEAGISLGAALEKGIHYSKEDLVIDVEKFRNELTQAHQQAMALSIEAVYVTKDNVEQILAKAAHASRSVSVEAGYLPRERKRLLAQIEVLQGRSFPAIPERYKPE